MKIQYLAVMLIGLSVAGSALATDPSVTGAVSATTATTSNVTALFVGTSSGGGAVKAETALGATPAGQVILGMSLESAGKLTIKYPDLTSQVFINDESQPLALGYVLQKLHEPKTVTSVQPTVFSAKSIAKPTEKFAVKTAPKTTLKPTGKPTEKSAAKTAPKTTLKSLSKRDTQKLRSTLNKTPSGKKILKLSVAAKKTIKIRFGGRSYVLRNNTSKKMTVVALLNSVIRGSKSAKALVLS